MSDDVNNFLKRRMKLSGTKELFKAFGEYPAVGDVSKADTSTFLQRRKALGNFKNLPGTIGKVIGAGALAGAALEKGISKLKSTERKEAESEIPSDVENKAKGGMTKGQKKVGKVMREFKKLPK